MVLESIKDILQPDTTHEHRCHDCGEEFETGAVRDDAECPECGGPPEPARQE
jgi:rRNA maturation endonuclease Nob1